MTIINKEALKEAIENAVNELKGAPDRHNCGNYKVKIYHDGDAELYHTIQQGNWYNQGHELIIQFEYSRPDYDTDQTLLDENDYEGSIADWDWENFTAGEDFSNFVEQQLDQAIENCREMEIEVK